MNDENTVTAPQEGDSDLEARVKGFNDEVIPLLGKYKLGLGATPLILPNGTIGARPQLFDDSKPRGEGGEGAKKPGPENTPTDGSRADAPEEAKVAEPEPELASA